MEIGNVLVIGNSGVGKSTLINAVLGENVAKTDWGSDGVTKELVLYASEKVPFRLIDTIGFEPSVFKRTRAINAVKKWSKESAKKSEEATRINAIWFCVDGTSRKLFDQTIKDLCAATKMWDSVPIIAVITKSYAMPDRDENIQMVKQAFARNKKQENSLKAVVPVVASTFVISEVAFAAPSGISELIEITNSVLPEGIKGADLDIKDFLLLRKRALAQGVIAAAAGAGVTVGALPLTFADAMALTPLEALEVNGIAKIFGIQGVDGADDLLVQIVECGTVGVAAKGVLSALKAIPGVNIAASVLNAIVAGAFVIVVGEASAYICEKIYLGEKSAKDIEWAKNVVNEKLSPQFVEKVTKVVESIDFASISKKPGKVISQALLTAFK